MSLYDAYVRDTEPKIRAAEIFVDQMEPINWASLINALVRLGISMKRIGLTVSVSHETVRGWRDGSIPNYEAGRKLLVMCATAGILVDSSGKARV